MRGEWVKVNFIWVVVRVLDGNRVLLGFDASREGVIVREVVDGERAQ